MRPPRRLLACCLLALQPAGPAMAQGGAVDALQNRVDALEAEIRRLTGQVERLGQGLREAERGSAARLDDLEFRVIELEGGDPLAEMRRDPPPVDAPAETGGQVAAAPVAPPAEAAPGPAALGVLTSPVAPSDERAALSAALRDLQALGLDAGRRSFEAFRETYPGSVLTGEGYHALGEAHRREGRYREAALDFLIGFRDHPERMGPENMIGLGETLFALGRTAEACETFGAVGQRFPAAGDEAAAAAAAAARRAGCS